MLRMLRGSMIPLNRSGSLLLPVSSGKQILFTSSRGRATLPELHFAYNALEPVISEEIMRLHHSKHHAAYVNNLNDAKEKLASLPEDAGESTIAALKSAIHFNGGGHINHSLFWQMLSPHGGGRPTGDLLNAIDDHFGSFEKMQAELCTASIGVQGSGWGWLAMCPKSGRLSVVTTSNQDPCEWRHGLIPILGIDVWEHAYYLQYKNARIDYVRAIWQVVNWIDVETRYDGVISHLRTY